MVMNNQVIDTKADVNSTMKYCKNKLEQVDFKKVIITTLVVGTLLTISNQFSAIFNDAQLNIVMLIFAFMTPFLVIIFAQMSAVDIVSKQIKKTDHILNKDTLIKVMYSHNIPLKSVMISFIAGTTNSFFILLNTYNETGSFDAAPITPMVQSYMLPLVVGLIIQSITYKKFIKNRLIVNAQGRKIS
jgi:hypothetical protein